jgi:multiple sugar transport system permease protein
MTAAQSVYSLLNRHARAVFILPTLIFVMGMMLFPIGYTVYLSAHNWNGSARRAPEFVGTDNYMALLRVDERRDERFHLAVGRTFIFSLIAVSAELVLGLGVALLINGKFIGSNWVKTLILLPMVATPVAIGMAWLLIYEPTIGLFNTILTSIGIERQAFLGSDGQALISLIFVDVWQWTPLMTLIILAGLAALPEDPYEAAQVDGASAFQQFCSLTLPMLFPTLVAAVLLRSIDALKTFDIIYTMTRGGPGFATETINIYGYLQAFEYFSLGRASSLLVIFFIIVMSISLLFIRIRRRYGVTT